MITTSINRQTSSTTTEHSTYPPVINIKSPSHHCQYQTQGIKLSTHLGITIRWSGAAAPKRTATAHAMTITPPLLILVGWSWC